MSASDIGDIISWGCVWLLILVLFVKVDNLNKQVKKLHTEPKDSKPAEQIRDMLDGYRTAGFTQEQAQELVQEILRTEVRQNGGWKP